MRPRSFPDRLSLHKQIKGCNAHPSLCLTFSITFCVSPNMSDCANELLTRSLFICFSAFLTTEIPPNKRPLPRWRASLRRDLTTENESTARVFFESGGAQAWAAYEAVRPTTGHCQGQADKRNCFAELDRQSLEFKEDLARMVGTVVPDPTVANLISPMAREACSILGIPVDSEPSIMVASTPSKRRRTFPRFVVAASTRADYKIRHRRRLPRSQLMAFYTTSSHTAGKPSRRKYLAGNPSP